MLKNSVPDVNLNLFEWPSNKYVCSIKDYNLLQSSEIVELMRPLLYKSNDVITIQTKPLLEYQTASQEFSPLIIRKLTTSARAQKQDFKFKKLEQPNIVSGVAAGGKYIQHFLFTIAFFTFYKLSPYCGLQGRVYKQYLYFTEDKENLISAYLMNRISLN